MTPDDSMYSGKADSYFANPRTEIATLLPQRVDRVLEIGCGSGSTMRWLRNQRTLQHAIGIELFSDAAERATSTFDSVLTGDIETMVLPEDKFDLIIALDVLEHLIDPWSVVARLHSVLRPDGAIVVSLPNVGHYSVSVPLAMRGKWNYAEDGLLDRTHLRFFTRRTAIDLLTCSGLVMDKIEYVRRGPMLRSAMARWYALKFLTWMLPRHLFDWQFLIRLKAS
jgi:SAM-dependent methyltransferase